MVNKKEENLYYFVDESGDPVFFDKRGNYIVGEEGCSPILIIGFIKTAHPGAMRKRINELRTEIQNDEYLKDIPSIKKTYRQFHAKDDCPEVREKFLKLIKTLDFKAQFIVARKRVDVFKKRHKNNEDIFYGEIVSRLFEKVLHKENNTIYFSKRGSKDRQKYFETAVQSAILNFSNKYNVNVETNTKVLIQIPTDEVCLQIIDYMNWCIFRAFTKGEMRYIDFLKDKMSYLFDIYDFDKYPNNIYTKNNIFEVNKISPLELVSQGESTA